MGDETLHRRRADLWELARKQHGVVARSQLIALGLTSKAVVHRTKTGRLHPLWRGVYAVGRPEVGQKGRWMAAVLSCGPDALLSHRSAATLWGLFRDTTSMEVVVPGGVLRRRPGIRVHRRAGLRTEGRQLVTGIPVTDPVATLVDLASCTTLGQLERAINEADRLDLVDPEALRDEIDRLSRRPGLGPLRRVLASRPLTETGLERRFLALVRKAGVPPPATQARMNRYRVDFFWPGLGLVVETDGWRYHRTPGQQATDHRRDQTHTVAGLTTLRFAESQVRYEPGYVAATLAAVVKRLRRAQ